MPPGWNAFVLVCCHNDVIILVGTTEPGAPGSSLPRKPACIVQLDADGIPVQSNQVLPLTFTGVPGHAVEWHLLCDGAVARDHEMRRRLGLLAHEPINGFLRAATRRVMHDQVSRLELAAEIGTGQPGERLIGALEEFVDA